MCNIYIAAVWQLRVGVLFHEVGFGHPSTSSAILLDVALVFGQVQLNILEATLFDQQLTKLVP